MVEIAMAALPGAFHSSTGALLDSYALASERRDRIMGDAPMLVPDMRLTVLSADGGDIATDKLVTLRVDRAIASTDRFDFIWLPGFRVGGEAALRERLDRSGPLLDWLHIQSDKGALFGASGGACALLLAAHLCDRKPVPVAPPLLPVLRAVFPRFVHDQTRAIVEHDRLLLSRGIASDLALVARALARTLSPETGRWLRSVSGADADDWPACDADPLVAEARMRLEQRFAEPHTIAALAAELSVSHAVLIRRFHRALGVTPSRFVQELRLASAKRMLERSARPIESIATAIGYSDVRVFRQRFRGATGMSATQWRRTRARE
jgi:transcriptional regulator GlxA family with amidase domain